MTMPAANEFRKTNVTMSRRTRRKFKQVMLDWEEEYDFPIELKESHALNAAIELILLASDEEAIEEFLDNIKVKDENDRESTRQAFKWFMNQYLRILNKNIQERIASDKRRVQPME
jgi:hypothetical protein